MLLVAPGTASSSPAATRLRRLRHGPFSVKTRGILGRDTFLIFQAAFRLVDCSREALAPEIVFRGKLENKILERNGAEETLREFLSREDSFELGYSKLGKAKRLTRFERI